MTEPEALYVQLLFALSDRNLGMVEANFASLVYNAFKALEVHWPALVEDIEKVSKAQEIFFLKVKCNLMVSSFLTTLFVISV